MWVLTKPLGPNKALITAAAAAAASASAAAQAIASQRCNMHAT